jgi:hypothetical protein
MKHAGTGNDARGAGPLLDREGTICVMSFGPDYFPVCRAAIAAKVAFDLGE